MRFNVTYDIVTQESAEHGDFDEIGFISQNVTLRGAISDVFATRTNQVEGCECVEPSDSRTGNARWITVTNGTEYETGACESRALHFPESLSSATRRRIARLMGVRV